MLENVSLQNILFLDIETAPQHATFDDAPKDIQHLWEKKARNIIRNEIETADSIYRQAGIYAEFGKIICISCGYFSEGRKFRIKSFCCDDEKQLLNDFCELLNKFFSK